MTDVKDIFESDHKLFTLIKTAIEREVESQQMYKEALGYCRDPLLQKVLEIQLIIFLLHFQGYKTQIECQLGLFYHGL